MIDVNMLQNLEMHHEDININANIFELSSKLETHLKMDGYFFPYYQGKTGYCWLESTLQCVSLFVKQKLGENYFFDDRYLMFFDKLEKSDLFFENIIQELNRPVFDRSNSYILRNAMTDKGQWEMSRNLIEKYGLVLKERNECENVLRTSELNLYISYLLRIGAYKIREIFDVHRDIAAVKEIKNEVLQNIFDVLIAFYGNQYEKFISPVFNNMKPLEFYNKIISFPFDNYISIYPTRNNQMVETEILYDGNVSELCRNRFLGVSNIQFSDLLDKQLDEDGYCWCSGDFGKFYVKKARVLDITCLNEESVVFQRMKLNEIDRADMFAYKLANLSHAFVMCRDENVEKGFNYFAYDSGFDYKKGDVCWISQSWIDRYLLQAVVRKKHIKYSQDVKKIKEYPWDFFGL